MGYLPIVVALVGFVILWAIVSRNSIKNKRQEAEASASLLFEQVSLRNGLIRQMQQQTSLPSEMAQLLEDAQLHHEHQARANLLLAAQQINTNMPVWPAQEAKNTSNQELHDQLQIAQRNLQLASKKFNIHLKQYNDLVGKYPTIIVARMTAHHPIDRL